MDYRDALIYALVFVVIILIFKVSLLEDKTNIEGFASNEAIDNIASVYRSCFV